MHVLLRSVRVIILFTYVKVNALFYEIIVAEINAIKYFNAVNATLFTSGVHLTPDTKPPRACSQSLSYHLNAKHPTESSPRLDGRQPTLHDFSRKWTRPVREKVTNAVAV